MSDYTIEFNKAVELSGAHIGYSAHGQMLLNNAQMIGLGTYPIFREDYRARLNGLICERYYHREIGFETWEMFAMRLRSKMNEIMPFYNRMYEADNLIFDPLNTIDMRAIAENSTTSDAETTAESLSSGEQKSRAVNSEFPQVQLAGNGDYATNAADSTGTNSSSGETSESVKSSTDGRNETRQVGRNQPAAALVSLFRDSLVMTDALLLDNLNDLFMGIYGNDNFHVHNNYGWTVL